MVASKRGTYPGYREAMETPTIELLFRPTVACETHLLPCEIDFTGESPNAANYFVHRQDGDNPKRNYTPRPLWFLIYQDDVPRFEGERCEERQ